MRICACPLIGSLIFPVAAFCQQTPSYTVGTANWTDVSFADTLNGWMCGDTSLMRTTDGGLTWSGANNFSGWFSAISACDKNTVLISWTSMYYNRLGKTTDGGITWATLISSCNSCISDIYFSHIKARDSLHAWVVTGGSSLTDYINALKTTNGGLTWTYLLPSHGSPMSFTDLALGPDSGVATLFARKVVYRSRDEGGHWRSDTLPKPCNGVSIGAGYSVWVVGDSGSIYHSSAYDVPFSVQPTGFLDALKDVTAIDTQTVWAVGVRGLIAKTTNGGTSWESIPSPTTATLNRICFVDSNHGWVVGDSGIVLRIQGGLVTYVPHSTPPPQQFALFQNYPNPFNPSTTISFSLPVADEVTVTIFDLLGRKIEVLYRGQMRAGTHELRWNGESSAAGSYFCRLQTSRGALTTKLVLVK